MHAELHPLDDPERVVAVATWDGRRTLLQVLDDEIAGSLLGLLRPTPVVVDDGAHRRLGTHGDVLLEPGTLAWFRAAVRARAAEFGLVARLVPEVSEGGWDPAAQYRTFHRSIERLGSS